ncbi:hypothetical protein BCR39DRAFT_515200 [Naematelia encephala]|uniref:ATP-dependent DNA ligase family profile domain-containing protein n=1 Tax=Naematelia encephala TaxID=71784 RepID=A0A1Y2BJA9_9TREE|nr:hypothetical protein BCR39DRAFT_515200 [Naematelia encephala]
MYSVASLIDRLGNPPLSPTEPTKRLSPGEIFTSWLTHLSRPLLPYTGKYLFRLLFPHEGSRRRYGLKETRLAFELEAVLGVRGLRRWDSVGAARDGECGTGCLGKEVEARVRERGETSRLSVLSIAELDTMLDELSSYSPFSQLSQQPHHPLSQTRILTKLYRDSGLSPSSLSVLTQIILRDLRPLLNPIPNLRIRNPTAMLRIKSTAAPAEFTLYEAMRCWDPRMLELYRGGRGNLDWCADAAEYLARGEILNITPGPILGVNVPIPKCRKARSMNDALKVFNGTSHPADIVWAETKYDGYRMQIHVEISQDGSPRLTIFSKSKRNSTMDRLNTHAIILAALGIPIPPNLPRHRSLPSRLTEAPACRRRVCQSVILEAEVVPFNEGRREGDRAPGIEEFWWLGAAGVTAGEEGDQFGAARDRHLCLVFFDVLLLDGESFLDKRYEQRRAVLQDIIRVIPGFSRLVERSPIPLHLGRAPALAALTRAFEESNKRREEGLVLKAACSRYTNMGHPWVKLKKDYIPNLGDCIDLVILGAGWDIDRARDLRVDTSVYTTFYVGTLSNAEQVKARKQTPHFEIVFRASYGMSRDQLEVYNEAIRHGRWSSKPYDRDDPFKKRLIGLSWTFSMPKGMSPPSVLFEHPLCGEVMGAGFQRLPDSKMYELRWPRLQKIFEPRERSWGEALHAADLVAAAHRSLGYAPPNPLASPEHDSIRAAWRSSSIACLDIPDTPSPKCSPIPMKRVQSAPDLFEIHKISPPTPRLSSPRGYIISTPRREMVSTTRRGIISIPSRVLRTSRVLRHALDSEVEDHSWPRTPITSPVGGKRRKDPYENPEKRRRIDSMAHGRRRYPDTPFTSPILAHERVSRASSPLFDLASSNPPAKYHSLTGSSTFHSSPILRSLEVNSRIYQTTHREPSTYIRQRGRLKPLSLRSRFKLAIKMVFAST